MPFSRLFYHVVWTTKQRLPLIDEVNRDPIFAAITAKAHELKGIVHAINAMEDHIHVLVSIPPSMAISSFVGQVKGSSSYVANRHMSADQVFAWQSEYGVVSVSERHVEVVRAYIDRQQEHHAVGRLNATLESFG